MPLPSTIATYNAERRRAGNTFIPLSSWSNPLSGSAWSHDQILTYRVLLKSSSQVPNRLTKYISHITDKLQSSAGFQETAKLLRGEEWQGKPRNLLRQEGKEFGSFLCDLAELCEGSPCHELSSRRETRGTAITPAPARSLSHTSSDEERNLWSLSSSTGSMSLDAKEKSETMSSHSNEKSENMSFDSHESSSSQGGSIFGNQSTINAEIKVEAVANHLIIELLQSVSQCTNNDSDRPFHLEWAISQDNFTFKLPHNQMKVKTRNDGGMVHRIFDSKNLWVREEPQMCYCSIEAGFSKLLFLGLD